MICSSRAVPSVATTSACVSPRVKSAEPCVRGSTPVRMRDRPHGARVAAVDARLAVEDLVADDLRFEVEQDVVDRVRVRRRARRPARTSAATLRVDLLERLLARLLLAHLVGLAQRRSRRAPSTLVDQRLVLRRRLPVPQRACRLPRPARGSASITACICWWPNTTAPSITSSGSSFASDSTISTAASVPATTRFELRGLELGRGRVEHVLAVDVAHARGADRAVERNAGERERGRRADHRRDVRIDLRDRPTSPSRRSALRCRSRRGTAGGSDGRSGARSAFPFRRGGLRA